MTKNEFGGTLYRNTAEMIDAIAEEYITARGSIGTDAVYDLLSEMSETRLAADCIESFGLNMRDDEGNLSHAEYNGYNDKDLGAAFREMRQLALLELLIRD